MNIIDKLPACIQHFYWYQESNLKQKRKIEFDLIQNSKFFVYF